ncbi:MAG: flippase-like domain-containing protein [Deltaproteobacteria bacterium]|nr:flippase-like domain-containing protein [Deltaproteobacteria bacterium]
MIKLVIGIIISFVFIYITFRGVEFSEVLAGLKDVHYSYLCLFFLFSVLTILVRAMRLQVLLIPIEKVPLRKLFPITCIGFMSIVLFPMRMGELVRPYLVHEESQIPFSTSLGAIFLERVFDALILLGMLIIVILSSDVSPWVTQSGYGLLVTFFALVSIILLTYFKTDLVLQGLSLLTKRLSREWQLKIERIVRNFIDGFHIISKPKILFYTLFLSLSIWTLAGLTIYSLFFFLGLKLPLISAFTVLTISAIGTSIPAAPGFLGTFQFSCMMALTMYNIPKESAVLFSFVYYILGIGLNITFGLICLPVTNVSFKNITNKLKSQSKVTEPEAT